MFALGAVTLQASSGVISAVGSDTTEAPSTGSTVAVTEDDEHYGTYTHYRTDTTVTSAQVYNFSEANASVPSSAAMISTTTAQTVTTQWFGLNNNGTPEDDSDDTWETIGAAIVDTDATVAENTTSSSPLWLTGGGESDDIYIKTSNSAATDRVAIAANNYLGLTASGSNINYSSLRGSMSVELHDTSLNSVLNTATLNAALQDAKVTLTGADDNNSVTISAGAASLNSVDTKQTWAVGTGNALTYNKVQVQSATTGETVAVTGSSDDSKTNYLNVALGSGNSVGFARNGTGSSIRDTVNVNGATLVGAAERGLTLLNDNDTAMSADATNAGILSVNGAVGGSASLAAGAKVTMSGASASVAAITAVDKLVSKGTWTLGSGLTSAVLGNDTVSLAAGTGNVLTADSLGNALAAVNAAASVNVVGDHTISANGTSWTLNGAGTNSTIGANFDSLGNATLGATRGEGSTTDPDLIARVGTIGKTLAVGANGAADTLTMAQNGSVTINNGLVSAVDSIAGGSTWLVRGGTDSRAVTITGAEKTGDEIGLTFERANNASVYGALSASTANGGAIESIDSLTGNVTLSHTTDSVGIDVMGVDWSIAKEANSTVAFDSTGHTASVSANASSDLTITASTDATVNVTSMPSITGGSHTMGGSFNGVRVNIQDGDGNVLVQLESDTAELSGIAGISSLNSGATVYGDNQFKINDSFNVYKSVSGSSSSEVRVTLGGSSSISVQNVVDGDAYTVTGNSGQTVYFDIDSSVASGGNARVTLNSAAVSIDAATGSSIGNAYVVGNYRDDLATIGGVKANDTINTSGDRDFTVVYDTSNVSDASSDPYVLAVNGARVSLVAANLTGSGKDSIAMSVAYDTADSTKPHITISRGIGTSTTVTVGAGVYNVGNSAQVTINDPVGYLYVDNSGNVTAEDSLVADIRQQREASLQSALATVTSPSVGPYYAFYNAYYGSTQPFANWNSTIAAYAAESVTSPTTTATSSGVNIYGDNELSAHPNQITLQSFLSNPINVVHSEGRDGTATLKGAVIDVSSSNNTLVAVGYSGEEFAVNHTILGGNRQSTIAIGEYAKGDNYVRTGNGGTYVYHEGSGKTTIIGGSGVDTIRATSEDHVEGGGGADYFLDEGSFEITDYEFDGGAGDVIVATKLSTSAVINPANVTVSGNQIAIAGGNTLAIGDSSTYDEATATRAVVVNAAGTNRTNLIWAGNYDSVLDASDLTRGAMMISYINGGAVNSVIGSAYSDTIYAGGNDLIESGAGNDYVSLQAADTSTGQRGATVYLSSGKTDVYGWKGGFDNEAGANILQATASNTTFRSKSSSSGGPTVTAFSEGASINFGDMGTDSTGAYNFLVGNEKVTFIGNDATVSVNSNADIADYYKGDKSGLYVGSGVEEAFGITLGSDHFTGVNKVALLNESRASIFGSSSAESITLSGSADVGAAKSVASGAGNAIIVSGGNDTAKSGNYLFFGEYGGVTLSSGRDTIQNFSFYQGKDVDPDMSSSDLLYLGDTANFQSASATASRLEISLGENTKVIVDDNFSTSDRKILRARFGNSDEIFNCKFGIANGVNTFTYDGETNAFFGSTSRSNDILKVDSSLTNVNIWLKDRNFDTNYYYGVRVIDASSVQDTHSTLVGDSNSNNIVYSAGSGSTNSLWGAGGQSNTLIGGDGDDTFFYYRSVGYSDNDGVQHGSNDVFQNVGTEDLIWLRDVTLNDINAATTSEGIVSGRVTVGLNDGSALTVTTSSQSANFRISNGNGGWTDIRATGGSNHGWE